LNKYIIYIFLGTPDIEVSYLKEAPRSPENLEASKSSKVCGARVQTLDCGDKVGDWLSLVLEISGLRLLQQWTSDQRQQKTGKIFF